MLDFEASGGQVVEDGMEGRTLHEQVLREVRKIVGEKIGAILPIPLRIAGQAINLRKLAAIDIVFLGFRFVLMEYACGVIFSMALGIFVLIHSYSFWQIALGTYLMCLGINYVPMLLYAMAIARQQSAHAELADELVEKRRAMSKYRRQSLLLLVPLAALLLAILGERDDSGENKSGEE